jgi:hypothetical protein
MEPVEHMSEASSGRHIWRVDPRLTCSTMIAARNRAHYLPTAREVVSRVLMCNPNVLERAGVASTSRGKYARGRSRPVTGAHVLHLHAIKTVAIAPAPAREALFS